MDTIQYTYMYAYTKSILILYAHKYVLLQKIHMPYLCMLYVKFIHLLTM